MKDYVRLCAMELRLRLRRFRLERGLNPDRRMSNRPALNPLSYRGSEICVNEIKPSLLRQYYPQSDKASTYKNFFSNRADYGFVIGNRDLLRHKK